MYYSNKSEGFRIINCLEIMNIVLNIPYSATFGNPLYNTKVNVITKHK